MTRGWGGPVGRARSDGTRCIPRHRPGVVADVRLGRAGPRWVAVAGLPTEHQTDRVCYSAGIGSGAASPTPVAMFRPPSQDGDRGVVDPVPSRLSPRPSPTSGPRATSTSTPSPPGTSLPTTRRHSAMIRSVRRPSSSGSRQVDGDVPRTSPGRRCSSPRLPPTTSMGR
jgi:hypothetical protein